MTVKDDPEFVTLSKLDQKAILAFEEFVKLTSKFEEEGALHDEATYKAYMEVYGNAEVTDDE